MADQGPRLSPAGDTGTPIFGSGGGGGERIQQNTSKIKSFGDSLSSGHHNESWKRPTNKTGNGATHVRSFHCKLTPESLANLDNQVNEWLDTHPDYEVKFVTSQVGEWTSKIKEPHLIVQLWL